MAKKLLLTRKFDVRPLICKHCMKALATIRTYFQLNPRVLPHIIWANICHVTIPQLKPSFAKHTGDVR